MEDLQRGFKCSQPVQGHKKTISGLQEAVASDSSAFAGSLGCWDWIVECILSCDSLVVPCTCVQEERLRIVGASQIKIHKDFGSSSDTCGVRIHQLAKDPEPFLVTDSC